MKKLISAVVLFASVLTAFGQLRDDPSKYWDMAKLKNAPAYRDAGFPDSEYPGLRSILYPHRQREPEQAGQQEGHVHLLRNRKGRFSPRKTENCEYDKKCLS